MSAILQAKDVTMRFGGLTAVENFNLSINSDELVGLIGPNGAGKTTIFNVLTGVYKPSEGEILLEDTLINGLMPHEVVALGMSRTFQNIRLFKDLTTIQNVEIAYNNDIHYQLPHALFRTKKYWEEEEKAYEECKKLLDIFDMGDYEMTKAKNLPYGQQRKLEIARALASKPKVLLLDEPAAGMNPKETSELMETIHFIRKKFNLAILLIEHDMKMVMGICERLIVLDYGKTIAAGTPEDIRKNPDVIRAYLGE